MPVCSVAGVNVAFGTKGEFGETSLLGMLQPEYVTLLTARRTKSFDILNIICLYGLQN